MITFHISQDSLNALVMQLHFVSRFHAEQLAGFEASHVSFDSLSGVSRKLSQHTFQSSFLTSRTSHWTSGKDTGQEPPRQSHMEHGPKHLLQTSCMLDSPR